MRVEVEPLGIPSTPRVMFNMVDPSLREALSHLPRLVVFAELARLGSFRATATALGLSPSTVTHHIQTLEDVLEVRLVERNSRTMKLTEAGATLLEDAERMVRAWRRGSSTARLHAAEPTGRLVVTAPDVLAERFVVPTIQKMLTECPRVTIDLRIAATTLDLVSGGIDVAIRRGPLPDSSYGARVLYRDRYGLVAHPKLIKAWPAHHPKDLAQAPWVRLAVHDDAPELVGPNLERYVSRGDIRAWASSGGAFIQMLSCGLGFGLVPRRLVEQELATGSLVAVLPDWSWGTADFFAVTPTPRPTDAKVKHFIDALLEIFHDEA